MDAIIIINYGELTTKNKNKNDFINQLLKNIKIACKPLPWLQYLKYHDHLEISKFQNADQEFLTAALAKIFGISNFIYAKKFGLDWNLFKTQFLDLSSQLIKQKSIKNFKINVRRINKNFAIDSKTITNDLAHIILNNFPLIVNVITPDVIFNIQIKSKNIYFFTEKITGAQGLPVGSSGKVLLLLSGGIDSPVAAYQLMKRGLEVIYLHFTMPPSTTEAALNKVKSLVKLLRYYNNYSQNLYICDFFSLQNELMHISLANYRITMMRRMFIKIAGLLAEKINILALATGDALGQVASQTLESINVINRDNILPIFRPLISFDKNEIIAIAKKINTYETSIINEDDCCSLFVPKQPITTPKFANVIKIETQINELFNLSECLIDMTNNINKIRVD